MRIINVKPYVVGTPPPHRGGRNWIFVKLTTDDGIEGIGEAYKVPFHPLTVARLIEDIGETYVVGSDPFQIERLWRTVYYGEGYESHDHHQHPDHTVVGVLSAIEMACWDIVGKALNQPVYNLLGGRYHDKLRSYTYLYPAPGDTSRRSPHTDPEAAARSALAHLEQGFTALKFDPLIDVMGNRDPREPPLDRLDNAEAVVRTVRETVGNRADILIGTHGQSTTSGAIRFARRIERYDPLWFEEPVPPENRDEMARVARATTIPVATGERLATKVRVPRTAGEAGRGDPANGARSGRRHPGGAQDRRDGGGLLRPDRTAPVLRTHRGRGQHPGGHVQPELPDPGEHRSVRRLPRGDPEAAHHLGERLHHPADEAGPRC